MAKHSMHGALLRAVSLWRKAKDGMMEHAYLITLGALVIMMAACALATSHMGNMQRAQMAASAEAPEAAGTIAPAPTVAAQITPLPTIAPLQIQPLGVQDARTRPVSGRILRSHAANAAVYWPALSCYKVHIGADIAAQAGEAVLAIESGTVASAAMDALWGWRVRIEHADGTSAVYAGLCADCVQPGTRVTRGMRIGTVMDALACERELGPHLHLELWQDGEAIDPAQYAPL